MRALLPSLKTFGGVSWHAAIDPCFRDICPPHLEILEVEVDDEAFPSLEVLEAAPALKKIGISGANAYGATALQAVIAALHRGVGLQHLPNINLYSCTIGECTSVTF